MVILARFHCTITRETIGKKNFCLSLTTSSSIPCGHNDREGASVTRKCFQGDRNRFLSFDYTVGGLVEPHRDRYCKGNRQSRITILMWLSGAHNGYVNKHTMHVGDSPVYSGKCHRQL